MLDPMLAMRFWTSLVGIGAITALVALGACSGKVETPPSGSGGGGAGTGTSDTTTTDTTTSTATGMTCRTCACEVLYKAGGCEDLCSNHGAGGPMNPLPCEGGPLTNQCKMCLATNCGVADPTTCSGLEGSPCLSGNDCWGWNCQNGVCTF